MSIQTEALRWFVGKPAKDIYGRHVGYVVGVTLDTGGKLHSVGVDSGGSFEEFSSSQIMIDQDVLTLIPEWKASAENFRKENSLAYRRLHALDELLKSSEIPNYVYEELSVEYKDLMVKLKESQKNLTDGLTRKIEELDKQIKHLEKFLGFLKVQHKTGELSDETYKVASDHLTLAIENTLKEKKDIKDFLESLNTQIQPSKPTDFPIISKPKVDFQQPIVIHLQDESQDNPVK